LTYILFRCLMISHVLQKIGSAKVAVHPLSAKSFLGAGQGLRLLCEAVC
jgi:hypothetical protein